jgi:hypothetical protein
LPASSRKLTAPSASETSAAALPALTTTLPPASLTVNAPPGLAVTIRLGGTSRLSVGVAVTWMMRSPITCSRTFLAGPEAGVTITPSAVFSKAPSSAKALVEARRVSGEADHQAGGLSVECALDFFPIRGFVMGAIPIPSPRRRPGPR